MSPAFLIFAGALAAILVWAFVSKALFDRHINDRIKREKALAERAADYRAKLKAKGEELQKRLDARASEGGVEPVYAEVMSNIADRMSYLAITPKRYYTDFLDWTRDTNLMVPVIDPRDDPNHAAFWRLYSAHAPAGGVIREQRPVAKPRVTEAKGTSKR